MPFAATQKVIDSTVLIKNLLVFIEANQADAFLIANPVTGLKPFAAIYNNASGRVIENFPSLCVLTDQLETPYTDEFLEGTWRVMLEIALTGSDAEALTIEARKYRDAVETLLLNIGNGLTVGARATTIARISKVPIRSTFDAISQH